MFDGLDPADLLGGRDVALPSLVLDDDPINSAAIGAWTFASSSAVATDLSMRRRNATLVGTPTKVTSVAGLARRFNGSTQYGAVASALAPSIDRLTRFSVWARIRINSVIGGADNTIVSKIQNSGNYPGWTFDIGNLSLGSNKLMLYMINNFFGPNYLHVSGSTVLSTGVWYDVGFTYDGSSGGSGVTFYLNGVPETTTVITNALSASIATSTALTFAARDSGAGNFSNIDVSLVRLALKRFDTAALRRLTREPWAGVSDPDAGLYLPRRGGAIAYTLALSNGNFTLTGQAISPLAQRKIALANASFALTGQAVTLKADRLLGLANGSFALSGQAMDFWKGRVLVLDTGSFTAAGQDVGLRVGRRITLTYGGFTLTGQVIDLIAGVAPSVPGGYVVIEVLSGTFQDGEALTGDVAAAAQADGTVVYGDYLFDLDEGSILTMPTGELLQAGSDHLGALHAARVNTVMDSISFGTVWGYNWKTATGEWATGAGTVSFDRHLGPGNALLPKLMVRNFNMDVFGGAGRIAGPGTASDMSFDPPDDAVGLTCAVHTDSPPAERLVTPFEGGVYLDAVDPPETGYSSLWVEYDGSTGYVGGAAFRLYAPVTPGKIALLDYQWRNPNTYTDVTHGPFTSGLPTAGDTILVTTYADSGLVTIEDKHIATLSQFGPQAGWTVTLADITGNPGGIPNATLNATHTIVERTGTDTYTILVGDEATSDATGAGGAAIIATYLQTNWVLFFRAFWVNVVRYDDVGRPVIGQEAFQGETNILVPNAPNDWTVANFGTWYAESVIPDAAMDRVSRGRAPRWATHIMWVWDYYNIRHVNAGAKASFRLGHFVGNVL